MLHHTFLNGLSAELIIIASVVLCFFFLLWLTVLQMKSKKELQFAYQKIKEDARFMADQNEEIMVQLETIKLKNIELNKYRAHLEKLALNKNEKLIKAKEKALESDRLKSSLLSNIYHEIRTPLNAIMGFVQLLSATEDIQNKTYLNIIEKNADDLLLLVDNIIELSKLQAQESAPIGSKIRISEFLSILYNETFATKKVLGKDKVALELLTNNIHKNDCLTTDKEKIYKILKLLIDNALKYTSKGSIIIACRKNQERFSFSIIDTGIGIKEEQLSDIFKAFHKIEDHKNLHRGIGIGLALAKHLTAQISGSINVESTYKKGTKFTISVPNLSKESEALKKKQGFSPSKQIKQPL